MKRLLLLLTLALLPAPALAQVGKHGTRDQCMASWVPYAAKNDELIRASSLQKYCACQTFRDPDTGDCGKVNLVPFEKYSKFFTFY